MFYYEKLSVKEIAGITGSSESRVKTQLSRARNRPENGFFRMLHSYETRAPGEPEALCVFFHDTIIHEIFPRIVPLFGQLQSASGFLIMAFLA